MLNIPSGMLSLTRQNPNGTIVELNLEPNKRNKLKLSEKDCN